MIKIGRLETINQGYDNLGKSIFLKISEVDIIWQGSSE